MNKLTTLSITLYVAGANLVQDTKNAYTRRLKEDRGSLTLEQIFWTVGLIILAGVVLGVVVAATNKKTGELPF